MNTWRPDQKRCFTTFCKINKVQHMIMARWTLIQYRSSLKDAQPRKKVMSEINKIIGINIIKIHLISKSVPTTFINKDK